MTISDLNVRISLWIFLLLLKIKSVRNMPMLIFRKLPGTILTDVLARALHNVKEDETMLQFEYGDPVLQRYSFLSIIYDRKTQLARYDDICCFFKI